MAKAARLAGAVADDREEQRKDLAAALRARQELGPDYDAALVESFVDHIQTEIDRRVDTRLAATGPPRGPDNQGFVIALVSLGTGIPISAISAGIAHVPGLMIAWAGIAAVNVAAALGRRPR